MYIGQYFDLDVGSEAFYCRTVDNQLVIVCTKVKEVHVIRSAESTECLYKDTSGKMHDSMVLRRSPDSALLAWRDEHPEVWSEEIKAAPVAVAALVAVSDKEIEAAAEAAAALAVSFGAAQAESATPADAIPCQT